MERDLGSFLRGRRGRLYGEAGLSNVYGATRDAAQRPAFASHLGV